jgi:hypothetical protein
MGTTTAHDHSRGHHHQLDYDFMRNAFAQGRSGGRLQAGGLFPRLRGQTLPATRSHMPACRHD